MRETDPDDLTPDDEPEDEEQADDAADGEDEATPA